MNFFDNIFGKGAADNVPAVLADKEITDAHQTTVDEKLFVDPTPPKKELESNQTSPNCSSRLKALVERSRFTDGYDAGLLYHNLDVRNTEVLSIKSEIKSVIRVRVTELRKSLGKLNTEIALIGEEFLMESSKKGLETTRLETEKSIASLEEEYLLAEDNIGLVQYGVQTYLDGFNRGYQSYLKEKVLIDQFSV